jgi:hypothetical protein
MKAVITGDIVASRKAEDRGILLQQVKNVLEKVDSGILKQHDTFEIFRGDSFQGVVEKPEKAIRAVTGIKAGLRMCGLKENFRGFDARISVGVGTISFRTDKVRESDGEAFHNSGKLLDQLNRTDYRLGIATPWQTLNEELEVLNLLADSILSSWTPASAETIFYYLTEGGNQQELAEKLEISQPAVHKRLKTANFREIEKFMKRVENQLIRYISDDTVHTTF